MLVVPNWSLMCRSLWYHCSGPPQVCDVPLLLGYIRLDMWMELVEGSNFFCYKNKQKQTSFRAFFVCACVPWCEVHHWGPTKRTLDMCIYIYTYARTYIRICICTNFELLNEMIIYVHVFVQILRNDEKG